MSTKGQIVIPRAVREKLSLAPSQVFRISTQGERLVLEKQGGTKSMLGSLVQRGHTLTRLQEKGMVAQGIHAKFKRKLKNAP